MFGGISRKEILQASSDLRGVLSVTNDIRIFGKNIQDQSERFGSFKRQSFPDVIKLRWNKLVFCKTGVKFHGHGLVNKGVNSEQEKVDDILPTNTQDEIINYCRRFFSELAELMGLIRRPEYKTGTWIWAGEIEVIFQLHKSDFCKGRYTSIILSIFITTSSVAAVSMGEKSFPYKIISRLTVA